MERQCQGSCRDGSLCLNKGKYEGFCWRHHPRGTKIQKWHKMLQLGSSHL